VGRRRPLLRPGMAKDGGMIELRPYQSQMVAEIRDRWAEGTRAALGVLPTGGGKTEIAMKIIDDMPEGAGRALIVTERKSLCTQWVQRLRRAGVTRYVGVLQGANTRMVDSPILVATTQTIRHRGVPEGVALIVLDEAHIWHDSNDTVLDKLGAAKVLGLTATPLRHGLGRRFQAVVIGARIRELIATGYLVRPRYFAPKPEAIANALEAVSIRAGDFAASELSAAMRGKMIIGDVVGEWLTRGENRQTIAFCVDKQHARDLVAEFAMAEIEAAVVLDDTDDEERARLFEAFDRREIRVLATVGVLGVGFDAPVAACAILARPTLSYSLYLQQGGRVLRPHEASGKTDALILDHAGNTGRFGLLEDFEPPARLSEIDKDTDRRPRHARANLWVCKQCAAMNPITENICPECGAPWRKLSAVVIIDGRLVDVEHAEGEALPGLPLAEVCQSYRMFLHYAEAKGLKRGWAWFATQRRYKIDEKNARFLIPREWQYLDPIPPDAETARWITADWQRQKIVRRYNETRPQP